jgi:hypothetical protein
MTYDTPRALRMALEQRLLTQSRETEVSLDRLRRRVVFERILARLQSAEPGLWVLKGGMALEVRLREQARLTKDMDLGLRDDVADATDLRERLVEALGTDLEEDQFVLVPGPAAQLTEDGDGQPTWRVKVAAELAGKPFGAIQLDISPRTHELEATEVVTLPNSLEFAGVATAQAELIDLQRHAAEKFHAMLKDFGDRENTRVRDLVDLVILSEHELIEPSALASTIRHVWLERDDSPPPPGLPGLPETWRERYESLATELELDARTFPQAIALVEALWMRMFPTEET